jgi:NADH:ubiquinone oxidoreductase subunit F (NADH-binding)
MPRLNVPSGSVGRAVGTLAVLEALRESLAAGDAGIDVVETGSDGVHWAAPVVALHGQEVAAGTAGSDPIAVAESVLAGNGNAEIAEYMHAQDRRLLARAGRIDPMSIDEARDDGAYEGLAKAQALTSAEGMASLEASGLRGRGGAYFPVHLIWQAAIAASALNGQPLLVVNAEEGEPGVFKDRVLMESDPHRLVEGVAIACHAIGAEHAYIYINGQADLSAQHVAQALADASAADLLGGLVVEIRRGAGGYVCGEETVILESIEGRRAVPRLRPPFPTERGLFGRPTVINNVETLANLPDLFRHGSDWFRAVGSEEASGTKLISLSGALSRPGLIEVPMGTTFSEILEIGGAHDLMGAVAGGPSGGLLPSSKFDLAIAPGALDPAGAVLGAGGIVAFDDAFGAAEVLRVQASYNAVESCGKCTPCREGGERLADAIERLGAGDVSARTDIDELVTIMRGASLCGLGQMAVAPVTSALQDFAAEIGVPS